MELKHHWMIFDFSKLKNSISCSCIFRKSITSHTKPCNSVRHFYYRLGRAATAMRAQMSKIFDHEFFLDNSVQGEKVQWGYPYVKHQPLRQGQTTTPGTTCATLFDNFVGFLTSPANHVTLKMQETDPTIYSPYSRRIERLTICAQI